MGEGIWGVQKMYVRLFLSLHDARGPEILQAGRDPWWALQSLSLAFLIHK